MHDVFISYARNDEDRASDFQRAISNAGWKVWWDGDLLPGQRYRDVIEAKLRASAAVVVLWSENALKSDFVQDEADLARQLDKLISVTLDGKKPSMGSLQKHFVDMSKWDGQDPTHAGLKKVLAGIRHKVKGDENVGPDHVGAAIPKPRSPGAVVAIVAIVAGLLIFGSAAGIWYYRGDRVLPGPAGGKASSSSSTVAEVGKEAPGTAPVEKNPEPSKDAKNVGGRPQSGVTPVSRTEKPKGAEPAVVPLPPAATSTGATAAAPTAERGCATLIAATRKRPDVAESFFDLGKCHYAEGRFNDSVIAYNSAIELNENLPKYYEARGLAKWKNDMATQGVNDLKSAIELKPTEASLYETRGQIYFAMRDYQRAQDDYDKATRLNPKSKRAWTGLADAAEKTGSDEIASAAKAQASALP